MCWNNAWKQNNNSLHCTIQRVTDSARGATQTTKDVSFCIDSNHFIFIVEPLFSRQLIFIIFFSSQSYAAKNSDTQQLVEQVNMKYFFYTRTRGLFRNCYPKERPPVSAGKWEAATGNFFFFSVEHTQKRVCEYFTMLNWNLIYFRWSISFPLHLPDFMLRKKLIDVWCDRSLKDWRLGEWEKHKSRIFPYLNSNSFYFN